MKEQIKAMVVGWSIWDAIWLPVEMKTGQYIEDTFWRIEKYLPTSLHWKLKDEVSKDITWVTSDDTAMSLAIIRSINKVKNINFADIMDTSVQAYRDTPLWYWWWTREIFDNYTIWEYRNLQRWMSAGNGIVMKLSPLSAFFVANNTPQSKIERAIIEITATSHGHPTSLVSSLVHNKLLMMLLQSKSTKDIDSIFRQLIVYSAEKEDDFYDPLRDSDTISILLENIYYDYKNGKLIDTQYILKEYGWWDNMSKSAYVVTTLWICYCLFLRWDKDLETLLDGINFGWDTDTYWAILWNMIWAYRWKFYTEEIENWVQNIENIKKEVSLFIETIL